MTTERELLSKILKNWAQEHNANYIIADPDLTDEAITKTGGYLSWIVRNDHANLDLLSLLDRLEVFLINRHKKRPLEGMFCQDCGTFYQYAEPNQEDGGLICYTCRNRPY
jgi:hypothetical protein